MIIDPVKFEDEFPEEAAALMAAYRTPQFRPDPRYDGRHRGYLPTWWHFPEEESMHEFFLRMVKKST